MFESLATDRDFVRTTESVVSWQNAMKRAIRSASELCRELNLADSFTKKVVEAEGKLNFPLFVPREFLARMEPGRPDDPLLQQVLPVPEELEMHAGFSRDPVGELSSPAPSEARLPSVGGLVVSKEVVVSGLATLAEQPASVNLGSGILKKYRGRALVVAHQACGVHCRYCFRRHFPYGEVEKQSSDWERTLAAVAADESLEEIILSGGDPLVLTDRSLHSLIQGLEQIPQLRRLRIHSRMPIVIPQRVTTDLVAMLSESRLASWLVVHSNHPAELDEITLQQLGRFVRAGVPVLNQAVLLKGVNDQEQIMEALCRRLIDARMQPYYLHQLDRVEGSAHFEVSEQRGLAIMQHLRDHLPGYGVPKYVREIAGEAAKHPLN